MVRMHAIGRAAVLAALGTAFAGFAPLEAQQTRRADGDRDRDRDRHRGSRIDTTFTFASNGSLEIHMPGVGRGSADVDVRGWDRNEVRIQGETRDGELSLTTRPRRVEIGTRSDQGSTRVEDLAIHVPYGTRVRVNNGNGDVELVGTRGPVEATSFNGDINISEAAERVEVKTFNGDIRVSDVTGRLSVGASNGDIEIDGITGAIEVSSLNGDIGLTAIRSSDVRAKTMSGRISYDGTVERTGEYSFNAFSGAIDMAIPANTGATLSISTFSGTVDSPDFPLTLMPGSRSRESRGQSMTFDLGSGGARISLESFSGEITIRERRGAPQDN